jgi:hypothetical protein
MKRSKPITPLRAHLPRGYIKRSLNALNFHPSAGFIYAVANGIRANKEIEEVLYWLALENLLDKILKHE